MTGVGDEEDETREEDIMASLDWSQGQLDRPIMVLQILKPDS